MANIVRGTTPTITMTNSDTTLDLRTLGTPLVSFGQNGEERLTVNDVTVLEHSLSFHLTQAQTLKLISGAAKIQVNFLSGSERNATDPPVDIAVQDNIHNEVMS